MAEINEEFVPLEEIPKEHSIVVYKAFNPNTNEFYIGATVQKDKRIKQHLRTLKNKAHNRHGNDLFQKAYDKDPNFVFTAIPLETKEEAFNLEKKLIKEHRGQELCLNMIGAITPPEITEEVREKISKGVRAYYDNGGKPPNFGAKLSSEEKKVIGDASKKMWEDPAKREKMMNYFSSEENKERLSKLHKGKIDSEETRRKKSLSKKGIPQSKELVEKRAAALRGKKRTPEQVEKQTEATRNYINSLSPEENQERLDKLSKQSAMGAEKTRRPIVYNGKEYSSVSEAIRAEGISSSTIYKRLKEQGYEVRK